MPRREVEQREQQPGRLRDSPAMLDYFLGGEKSCLHADRSSFDEVLG